MYATVVLILGLVTVVFTEVVNINNMYDCGQEISLDDIKTVTLNYKGGYYTDECQIEFTLDETYDYEICVQPVSLNLSCYTEITYHEYHVTKSWHDGKLACRDNHDVAFDETCARYVSSFFLAIRYKFSYHDPAESAEIRVYAKERQHSENLSTSTAVIVVPIILCAVCVSVIIVVFAICIRRRQQRQYRNAGTVAYTLTTTAAPANQPAYQPSGYTQVSVPGTNVQVSTDGYTVHPMVSAVPNQTQLPPGQYGNQPGSYNNQPGSYNNQPGSYNNQPGQLNNQPVPYNTQPVPYNNQPAPYNNQPVPYNNQSVSQQLSGIQSAQGEYPSTAYHLAPSQDDAMPPPSYDSLTSK